MSNISDNYVNIKNNYYNKNDTIQAINYVALLHDGDTFCIKIGESRTGFTAGTILNDTIF